MALDLGPCAVYYNNADLGYTQGGVTVKFTEGVADLKSDQFGSEPMDQMVTGMGATITVPLANYTIDNLALALGRVKKNSSNNYGFLGNLNVGTLKSGMGKQLICKKYVNGSVSNDEDNWITFPIAAPDGNIEIKFDGTNQRIIETTFRAFPANNNVLYIIGDANAANNGT
jgi:hypothetical protein